VTGIEAGKTWSRVGPEVAPTSSSASGVFTLSEYSENQGAGTWPNPPTGVYEAIAQVAVTNATTNFVSFTSIPSGYDSYEIIMSYVDPGDSAGVQRNLEFEANGYTGNTYSRVIHYITGTPANSSASSVTATVYTSAANQPAYLANVYPPIGQAARWRIPKPSSSQRHSWLTESGSGVVGRPLGTGSYVSTNSYPTSVWGIHNEINAYSWSSFGIRSEWGRYYGNGTKFTMFGIKAA